MKSRLLALGLVALLLLAGLSVVAAQADVQCLGVSADDCALIQAVDSASFDSFSQSFTFSLNLGGLAAMGAPGDISISANGSGPLVIDRSKATPDDPTAGLAMAMDISGSVSGTGEDVSGDFSFVIVDGVFYAQNPETGAWEGMALADLTEQFGGMTGMGAGGVGAMMDPSAMMGQLPPEAAQALGALATLDPMSLPGFLTQHRLPDEVVDGQNSAVYQFTVDLKPLLESSEFQEAISAAMQAGASSDPSMAQMGMMVPMMLQGLEGKISVTRWLGIDDKLPHRLALDIDGAFDLSMLMGAGAAGGQSMEPITLDMNLTVDLTGINGTAAPVAPEGATMQG